MDDMMVALLVAMLEARKVVSMVELSADQMGW